LVKIILGIFGGIITLCITIFVHELAHFIMAKRMGVRVDMFSLGFGPRLWSFKKGETEYVISLIPLGGFVKMAGEEPGERLTGADWEFYSKPFHKKCKIVVVGSIANYLLGTLLFCIVFMGRPVMTSTIGEVKENFSAHLSGIMAGDRVVEINKWDIRHWGDVLRVLAISKDDVHVIVEREGHYIEYDLSKMWDEGKGLDGETIRHKIIGILPKGDMVHYGLFQSIQMGVREALFITKFTLSALGKMLIGELSIKTLSGPYKILSATGQAAMMGIFPLLAMMALINVSLAIINLMPFPPLDGGHMLIFAIEKVKNRPINRKVLEVVQQTGWILMIILLMVVTWNDIFSHF
jgi:regulator of sigma E protease